MSLIYWTSTVSCFCRNARIYCYFALKRVARLGGRKPTFLLPPVAVLERPALAGESLEWNWRKSAKSEGNFPRSKKSSSSRECPFACTPDQSTSGSATEGWGEAELAKLITRDSMVGTGLPKKHNEVA